MASPHPVPVKSVSQQVLTSLHRLRSGWMSERNARINCLRGLLRELGVFIPTGARQVVPAVWALVEDADADVPDALRPFLAELASYVGLTPREYSSGLRRHLGRISKRGDGYLRTLLIHGARSVLLHARANQPDRLRQWAHQIAKTHVHNKAAVAVANKMARVVWAVWTHARPYPSQLAA